MFSKFATRREFLNCGKLSLLFFLNSCSNLPNKVKIALQNSFYPESFKDTIPKDWKKEKINFENIRLQKTSNVIFNSDAVVAIVPYSLCSKYLKIDPRLSLVFPSQGVPLMWHFLLSRSNLNNAILIKWIKSLENKSIVDKLVSQGWYLPFNSIYIQSKYKSKTPPILGPSEKCWENSWSFPLLTNEQKINLKNIWNESLSP